MARMIPRGNTACIDAYLTPLVREYINKFKAGFDTNLDLKRQVLFMQSDGGLVPADRFSGYCAVLSGPAGGVVGYAKSTAHALGLHADDDTLQVIGFDMGGTSTDVSRYAGGSFEHVLESETAGVSILAPQLDINTVAAGGGSRLFFKQGALVVGPESAKAHPGPICYRKVGGMLALTDANLVLGRLLPHRFPAIFGQNENLPLDTDASRKMMQILTDQVNAWFTDTHRSLEEIAAGFIRVANEAMCRPIRELSQARGYEPQAHVLACFGGAGAQHVCAVARALGISRAVVHAYAGILSAYGMGLADVVVDLSKPCGAKSLDNFMQQDFAHTLNTLQKQATEQLQMDPTVVVIERYLNLRYAGTDNAIMVKEDSTCSFADTLASNFRREYGFELSAGREVLVDDARVRAIGRSATPNRAPIPTAIQTNPTPSEVCRVYFAETGWLDGVPVYELMELCAGHVLPGPAMIAVGTSTCVVEPGCKACITQQGDIVLHIGAAPSPEKNKDDAIKLLQNIDPAQLGVFSHRFMSIAEQMGRTLQRTASSVNIKERLDFSCALFSADGGLVANAPHVPVHLGAMSETVRIQLERFKNNIQSGDVLVANDPNAGGSHLPDITVITPVFDNGKIVYLTASRGHHADVGGTTPGSMPADSTRLEEEGAIISGFKLVKKGIFDDDGIKALLRSPVIPCRNERDVLSDLKAQIAANAKGAVLLEALCQEYGQNFVLAYMRHVRANAESCVRAALKAHVADKKNKNAAMVYLKAIELMDDGNPICLEVCVNANTGSAVFDFSKGTGPQVFGNWNAPRAVTAAAVMYCLRLLVGRDIPLNSGCLDPVEIILTQASDITSMLAPSPDAAVCAGNVLTSQRVTDVILKAFSACAASQGCMNNFVFGDDSFGYYETICGGAGAGPSWHGTSAVQVHMTNTRITDLEILEKRYPVYLHKFHIRRGSGGSGQYCGGDGVVREMQFLKSGIVCSLLTERRAIPPFGLNGGQPAMRGRNLLITRKGRIVALPAKVKVSLNFGDAIRIETPGGGGFGSTEKVRTTAASSSGEAQDCSSTSTDKFHHTASLALGSNAVDF
mmetsp:Transcript_21820/g.33554  ORF Transcript_21820/g.33554 Transcript_21820/m.33554 type:complete len:1078 (-) Transcript_21820:69-3302(-)